MPSRRGTRQSARRSPTNTRELQKVTSILNHVLRKLHVPSYRKGDAAVDIYNEVADSLYDMRHPRVRYEPARREMETQTASATETPTQT